MFMKAVLVCPPKSTKFCACVATPLEEFEKVGVRAVNVKPASAIGVFPALLLRDRSYDVGDEYESFSMLFEYNAEFCAFVEFDAALVGHMPPKVYTVR